NFMKSTDAVVIGGGPGGYVCAIRLAQRGLKTTVVEREDLGGVCLNWGCIPSKAMISAANLYHRLQHAETFGIKVSSSSFDWDSLKTHKSKVVKKLTSGVEQLLKTNKVEIIRGTATFAGKTSLKIQSSTGSEELQFKHAVIATGARPIELPTFPID